MRLVDGNRIVHVLVSGYFTGGIDTVEQLDAALAGLREVCEKEAGSGKKVNTRSRSSSKASTTSR